MVRSSHSRPGLSESSKPVPAKKYSKSILRKLEKREKFHKNVKDAVDSLSAKKAITKKKRLRSRQRKLKAYDLSTLSEYLPDLDVTKQPPAANVLKLNCKNRNKLVEREGKQLKLVLNNTLFQMDPLSAIHQHLQSTQPPETNKERDTKKSKSKSKSKRKNVKKPSSGSDMMVS